MTHELLALSPLDGRYYAQTQALQTLFSEFGLFKYRLKVEIEWLIALSQAEGIDEVRRFNDEEMANLQALVNDFDIEQAKQIKAIEQTTRHDVKALEYYIKEKLSNTTLHDIKEFVHFACTSEDINNLAYALMVKDGLQAFDNVARKIVQSIDENAARYADLPMLSRTHGQSASPTTLGKEFKNVSYRLHKALEKIHAIEHLGKINGAVGNFNAHVIAYPGIDWPVLAERFVTSLGLTYNPYTTQIEPHDNLAAQLSMLANFNTILIDFARDMWGYISLDYIKQRPVEGEVGSSTMPHKVNPIDFENAEGNLGLANALAIHMSSKLPISRFQRDLTDSTVLRNLGSVFGYIWIALRSLERGMGKIEANETVIANDLDNHWEVLAEAVQTVMRRHGIDSPYEKLKALTRGKPLTCELYLSFVESLEIPAADKKRLLELTPRKYIGIS